MDMTEIAPETVVAVIQAVMQHADPDGVVHIKLAVAKMENANLRAALEDAEQRAAQATVASVNGDAAEVEASGV